MMYQFDVIMGASPCLATVKAAPVPLLYAGDPLAVH
jgi:hypothetical protein